MTRPRLKTAPPPKPRRPPALPPPQPGRFRRTAMGVVGIALVIIAGVVLLSLVHTPTSSFAITARASALEFRTAAAVRTHTVSVSTLTILGVTQAACEDGLISHDPYEAIHVGVDERETVSIEEVVFNEGQVVRLNSENKIISIEIAPGESPVSLRINTDANRLESICGPQNTAQSVELFLENDRDIRLVIFEPSTSEPNEFIGFSQIQSLTLVGDIPLPGGGRTTVGSLIDGWIWIEHIGLRVEALNATDEFRLNELKNATIRRIQYNINSFTFSASGNAGEIKNRNADLRPNMLHVIQESQLIRVIIGLVSFFGGLQLTHSLRHRQRLRS